MIRERIVARVVLFDAADSVLLVRYGEKESQKGEYWVPPGGALEQGESFRKAAQRELAEETGLVTVLFDQLWECSFEFCLQGELVHQTERYFLARTNSIEPAVENTSPEAITGHRWWGLNELGNTDELIYPDGLFDRLTKLGDAVT